MPFDAHGGERLRFERERLGLTQQAMADAVGVRREMWSKYERGVAVPGGDVLETLVGQGVDLIYVLTGDYLSVYQAKIIADQANGATSHHLPASSGPTGPASNCSTPTDSDLPTSRNLPADEQLLLDSYRGLGASAKKALLSELLTGGKKAVRTRKPTGEGLTVSGSGHRVAGRDYHE